MIRADFCCLYVSNVHLTPAHARPAFEAPWAAASKEFAPPRFERGGAQGTPVEGNSENRTTCGNFDTFFLIANSASKRGFANLYSQRPFLAARAGFVQPTCLERFWHLIVNASN